MKCPACGFDSADDAQWCDFCKEPFRKKAAAVPEVKTNGAAVVPSVPLPPPAEPASGGLPPEFAHLDPGERIPTMPPWLRLAAWGFLALWFILGAIILGVYLGKRR